MQIFPNGWHKPFSTLHFSVENFTQFKAHKSKKKTSTETRKCGWAVYSASLKKMLSWEFWYTNVCVGSNPLPVRKRFERDEAEPWADKFSHTGTSIPDDSPKQKKSQRHPWLIPEQFQSAQKGGYPAETLETRMYTWVGTQIFWKGWHKPLSRLNLWNANSTHLKKHRSHRKTSA